jgi:hypothetical protein
MIFIVQVQVLPPIKVTLFSSKVILVTKSEEMPLFTSKSLLEELPLFK